MASLYTFTVNTRDTIRDNILRTIKNGLTGLGVSNPNVGPGSDYYILATAVANELCVVEANAQVLADQMMFDTATGDDLDRLAAIIGLTRRPAGGSSGFVVLSSSASTGVTVGTQLTDSAGLRYEVSVGGTYANGALIPVAAIDTGTATNLDAGVTLQWASAPTYSEATAAVATGGLTNGVDAEDEENLRARCYAVLQNPPSSGNWEHLAEIAEASYPTVQKAFVYPALQGPASAHIAVTAAPTATNKSRVLNSIVLSNTVTPYVSGKMPEHVLVTTTATTDVNADISFSLTLPAATNASPPGPGGGWLDGSPWPTTSTKVTVTAVTSNSVFTVDATTAPTAFVSRIAWLSPSNWTLYTATVTAVSGTSGAYVITLDKPFVGIATGSYIWPQCLNQQTYIDAVLAQFAALGPGEKTSNSAALTRGYRHPAKETAWPSTIGSHFLKSLTTSGSEVSDAQFLYRSSTTPSVPGTVTDAPNIFVPRHIGFYPA